MGQPTAESAYINQMLQLNAFLYNFGYVLVKSDLGTEIVTYTISAS